MRVAMTGSSGFIGRAVAERLEGRGDQVVRVRRGSPDEPGADWDPAGWFRPGALEGVDAVVQLGGESIGAKGWSAVRRAALRSSRIDATRTLVEHLATLERPPRVLVAASAIGYYGADRGDEELTEAATMGEGFLAELTHDWEAVAAPASAAGVRVVHARFAPVLALHGELMQRLLPPFRMGAGGPLGSGRQWFSWVTLHDAVEAIVFALDHDEITGPVNVAAPGAVTNARFTRALGHVLHRPTVLPLPAFALRAIFGRDRADETLLASQRAVPARLLSAGFEFRDPEIDGALTRLLHGAQAQPAAAR